MALLRPAVKLGIALAILFVSFMCFAQSGRLYSHVVTPSCTKTSLALSWIRDQHTIASSALSITLPSFMLNRPSDAVQSAFADGNVMHASGIHAEGSLQSPPPGTLDI